MTDIDFHFPSTDADQIVGIVTFRDCDPDVLTTDTYMKLPEEKIAKAIVIEKLADDYFNLFLYSDFDRENKILEMFRVSPENMNTKLLEVLEIE